MRWLITHETGFIHEDDEISDNKNNYRGAMPDGKFTKNTRIEYCCRTDEHAENDIILPTDTPFELSSVSACARNAPEGGMVPMGSIPRTGLSLETKKWDLFRMRRLDGISSCIIVIITGKLNRGYLLENCCCYLVIKISRNTSSTGVLIDLKLGVEKIVLREFKEAPPYVTGGL